MVPPGMCFRVVLGMDQVDRNGLSNLMRPDGRRLRALVGSGQVSPR